MEKRNEPYVVSFAPHAWEAAGLLDLGEFRWLWGQLPDVAGALDDPDSLIDVGRFRVRVLVDHAQRRANVVRISPRGRASRER